MSYEGYEQLLCKNGHYTESDVYNRPEKCDQCGAKFVWTNDVDTTNGEQVGFVELAVLKNTTCKKCRQSTRAVTYKIPNNKKKGKKKNVKQRESNR